ncbi:MAG: hypothetical protein AUK44_02580 [Porphyromonadaceae bacterium CG2_30_38_12]|nr:MAG: hypothetical protein AUK44_02580 [Porphyromonadaceae bacterium CG2_30_38_12]
MNLRAINLFRMKTILSLVVVFLFVEFSFSQQLSFAKNEPALVYSLPKTVLSIDITCVKTTQTQGIYYQYAERYLATKQIVLENKTSFALQSIGLSTQTIADSKRTYKLFPNKKNAFNKLAVNERGILCGINICTTSIPISKPMPAKLNVATEKYQTNDLLPLGEEYLMAGSTAKLAEGAAKQIYRIRESRLSLLTGDLEHLPADGASMHAMIDGMNRMEKELTELFVGKITLDTIQQSVQIIPDSALNMQIAFRFSTFKGLVSSNDLSGAPYFVNTIAEKINWNAAQEKDKKPKNIVLNTLYPAPTKVEITNGMKTLLSQNIAMPQFGVVVPVSLDVLSSHATEIRVSPETGRLLSIEK